MAVTCKGCLFVISFTLMLKVSFSQIISYRIVGGLSDSKITNNSINQPRLIENTSKIGYRAKLEIEKNIGSKFNVTVGLGLTNIGGMQILDGGYAQDNIDFVGYYPDWSIIRYKDAIRLNYYLMSLSASYRINKLIKTGLSIDNMVFRSGSIKSKVYISDYPAEYAEIILYRHTTHESPTKFVFSPEVFVDYEASSTLGFKISYMQSVNSIYKNSSKYYQSVGVSVLYTL